MVLPRQAQWYWNLPSPLQHGVISDCHSGVQELDHHIRQAGRITRTSVAMSRLRLTRAGSFQSSDVSSDFFVSVAGCMYFIINEECQLKPNFFPRLFVTEDKTTTMKLQICPLK
ncbi:predicted protein [Histoplasma capsulatum H143]|uniref:Uncharacterized protein n=1 Tax=Ajellomyces capsulatus (strain H143) TaxID=544712 RepID=C6H8V5_AJECH|nr:predicted protein [Histoplasma capsulatum H143]